MNMFSSTFIVAFNLWEIVLKCVCTELEQTSFGAQNSRKFCCCFEKDFQKNKQAHTDEQNAREKVMCIEHFSVLCSSLASETDENTKLSIFPMVPILA